MSLCTVCRCAFPNDESVPEHHCANGAIYTPPDDVAVAALVYRRAPISFLLRVEHGGVHTHVALFSGPLGSTRSLAGHLVLRHEEFEELRALLEDADLRRGPDVARLVTVEVRT